MFLHEQISARTNSFTFLVCLRFIRLRKIRVPRYLKSFKLLDRPFFATDFRLRFLDPE